MRAWPSRDQNKVPLRDNGTNGLGDGRWGVNEGKSITGEGEGFQFNGKLPQCDGGKGWRLVLSPIPPISEGGLRICVNQNARAITGLFSGNGEVRRKGLFFPRSSLD